MAGDLRSRRKARLDEVLTGLRPSADERLMDAVLNAPSERPEDAAPVRSAEDARVQRDPDGLVEVKSRARTGPLRLTGTE